MPSQQPPAVSLRLIQWLCREELVEELQGNLCQFYAEASESRFRQLRYWWQVIGYLRLSTLKTLKTQNSGPMFIFNPILTLRNLYKHKSTTLISMFGFVLGLVSSFLLYFYIYNEVNTDSIHAEKEQIYRALRVSSMNGTPYRIGVTSGPYGPALQNDYPSDVTDMMRVKPENGLMAYGEKKFFENRLLFADPNFFDFFNFPLVAGDPKSVLTNANAVVLTKATAEKYFGDEDPIGKVLELQNQYSFMVSGIIDDYDFNSHLEFSMIFSLEVMQEFDWFSNWWNNNLITYVKVPTRQQALAMEETLDDFMIKYMGEDFKRSGRKMDLDLEPLEDIYFNNDTRYDFVQHGSFDSIIILSAVAIAILFIACFNYVNLSIAQSFMRAKEVGVRKAMGGSKARLIIQFLSETLMILIFSIGISILVCELVNPLFNSFFGLEIALNWTDQNVLLFVLILGIVILLSSGAYPALLLSSFKSVAILRGSKLSSGKKLGLRKALVVVQFSISIFLIVSSVLVYIQTEFLNNKELGFEKEAIVLIDLNNSGISEKRETFKDRLNARSNILGVTSFSGEPGGFHDASTFQFSGLEVSPRMRTLFTDTEYFEVMDIEIVAGRGYSKEIASDEEFAVVVNEAAVRELGITNEEVLGKRVTMPGWDVTNVPVIGVARDYNFLPLSEDIEPLGILCGGHHRKMAVKLNMANAHDELLYIDEVFSELSPGFPLAYEFLDQRLERLYAKERQQTRIFTSFSMLSIFLACLGIFGLAAYSAQQRQKELGIRKVLGATAQQIIGLISKEFVLLVLVAIVIALPAAYYFIGQWLGGYAYRIPLIQHWYVFFIGGLATVLIALITVSFKTYKAAVSDPTDSIRNE
ncbi:MAG: ABC transporter permease [Ekhidna sp.]